MGTFKGVEFDTFLYEAGANRFNMTPRKWMEATNTVSMIFRAGRNGGTYYAHKDIAFEFGSSLRTYAQKVICPYYNLVRFFWKSH